MRDPKRIERVLTSLRAQWQQHPDWRLGQLLVNLAKDEKRVFQVEDDEWIRLLQDPPWSK